MGQLYTKTKIIPTKPTRLQKWLFRGLCIAITILAISAGWQLINWYSSNTDPALQGKRHYGSIDQLLEPTHFTNAYLSANGGPEMLHSLNTIRVSGSMESDGLKRKFTSIKKRPNKSLIIFDFENHSLAFGFNGETAWQRTQTSDQDSTIQILEKDAATAVIESSKFFGPVMSALLLDQGEVSDLSVSKWDGQDCILATIIRKEGTNMRIYVDPSTMHVLARIENFDNNTVRKTLYKNYRALGGMQEAFHIETYLDDTLQSLITIEKGNVNSGILSQLFNPPTVHSSN